MKKWILWGCMAALAMGMSGCVEKTNTVPETTAPVYEPHITMSLRENCMVDADVEAPEDSLCASPAVALWEPNPESVKATLFPQDDVTLQEIDPESYGFSLKSHSGAQAELYPGSLYFSTQNTAADTAQHIAQYQADHPEKSGSPLDFLSPQDAVSLGTETLKALEISLDPVLERRYSMTREDLQEQQISNWNDTYYLRFTFSYEGIPLYGTAEELALPSLDYNNVPPSKTQAEMLITAQGIQYLNLTNLYVIVNSGNTQPRMAPREALNLLRQSLADQGSSDPHRVTRICLQYIPVTAEAYTTLTPYWCFWMDYQYIDEYDGKTVSVKNGKVERFNAYTGADFLSGG